MSNPQCSCVSYPSACVQSCTCISTENGLTQTTIQVQAMANCTTDSGNGGGNGGGGGNSGGGSNSVNNWNCIPGTPNPNGWSACPTCIPRDQTSNQSFQYQFVKPIREAAGSGIPCSWDQVLSVRTCSGIVPECPPNIDCQVSTTSSFTTPCSEPCGTGTMYVLHNIVQPAVGLGKPCPWNSMIWQESCNTQSCQATANCNNVFWPSVWSPCNVACGPGFQYQTRLSTGPNDECPLIRTQSCNLGDCSGNPNCIPPSIDQVVEICMANCLGLSGTAVALESKYCSLSSSIVASLCGFMNGSNLCSTPIDCQVSNWSSWGACSELNCSTTNSSGALTRGEQFRTRTILVAPQFGGAECPPLIDSQDCPCTPVDCSLSSWTTVADCSEPCGGGQQMVYRTIIQQGSDGGAVCSTVPTDYLQLIPCNTQSCGSCSWMSWSDFVSTYGNVWTTCSSNDCTQGFQRQGPRPLQQAAPFGTCNPADAYQYQKCSCGNCPSGCNGLQCSGNGTCDSSGHCQCNVGYFGDDCSNACPVGETNEICNGLGTCGASTNGTCSCFGDVTGSLCDIGGSCIMTIYKTPVSPPGSGSCDTKFYNKVIANICIGISESFTPIDCNTLNGFSNGLGYISTNISTLSCSNNNFTTAFDASGFSALVEDPTFGVRLSSDAFWKFGGWPNMTLSAVPNIMMDNNGVTSGMIAQASKWKACKA